MGVDFLAECEIMDYSLLLGICEISPEEAIEPIPGAHPLERHLGGVRSVDPETGEPGRALYYLGIIDILIHYNVRKTLETAGKGMIHDRDKISAVPPDFYA